MAGQEPHSSTVDTDDVPQINFDDHQRTYDAFLTLTKWSIVAIVILLIGMAVFLV